MVEILLIKKMIWRTLLEARRCVANFETDEGDNDGTQGRFD